MSWITERSPARATVCVPVEAQLPRALERKPSIPLAPRFAITWTERLLGFITASRSRMGIEEATQSVEPDGMASTTVRAMAGSLGKGAAAKTVRRGAGGA